MKRIFYTVIAIGMLLISSCSQEEGLDITRGEDQMVTFNVEIPMTESRTVGGFTIGSGVHADKLMYAIYEADKEVVLYKGIVSDTEHGTADDSKFTITIPMAKNVKYDLLFFAYNESHCAFDITAGVNTNLKRLKFKDIQTPNVDAFDAFVGSLKAHGVEDDNRVILKRPFAQVNAATTINDLGYAASLQTEVTQSCLVIKGIPQYYDILEGIASGSIDEVVYRATNIMTCDDNNAPYRREVITVNGIDYRWLTLAYVLAGDVNSVSTHNAVFLFMRNDGDEKVISTLDIDHLPIQRNYSTNVVGTLLTKSKEYTIWIDYDF